MPSKIKFTNDLRADLLEEAIGILDTLYDDEQDCILADSLGAHFGFKPNENVPNTKYDMLRHELEKLRPESDTLKGVTASTRETTAQKVKHDPPLTSIAKCSHEDRSKQEEMLFKWLSDVSMKAPESIKNGQVFDLDDKEVNGVKQNARKYNGGLVIYPRNYFYQAYKLDGVALALYYEEGELKRAGLRPRNGVDGEDVTENVKHVRGVLQTLKKPVTCSIRGEIICLKDDFDQVQKELEAAGEDLRANPRNHASGGIRQFKDTQKTKAMRLNFVAYAIEGHEHPLPYKTETERAKYCAKDLGIPHVQIRPFNFYDLDRLEKAALKLQYETDGVIIGVDSLHEQEQLGRSGDSKTGNSNGKRAWKFAEEHAHPMCKEIEWNTGRSGVVKPVAIFDDVPLAGTNVGRATLHNLGFMIRNMIGVGTVLDVLKAGKIIPKVVGVISGAVKKVVYPDVCPSCGEKTHVEHTPAKGNAEEMYELYCLNKQCPAQNINTLLHFLENIGVLGLGESKVTQLVEGGKVKIPADFFKITTDDAEACGLSERQALLALANIHLIPQPEKVKDNAKLANRVAAAMADKKSIPLWKLFAAFGIDTAGKSAGKALASHFNSFVAICSASAEDLEQVGDIGSKTAQIVYDYLLEHKADIDELLDYVEPELPKTGPLTGMSFCLSGGFPGGKKALEDAIEKERGGKVGGISKSSTALVQGDEPGEDKETKAKKYGVPILTYDQFKAKYLK